MANVATIDQARDELYNSVHAPVFFAKLAEAGIHPGSAEERTQLLEMGHILAAAEAQNQLAKQAQSSSHIKAAHARLLQVVAGEGGPVAAAANQRNEQQIQATVKQAMARPELRDAAVVLGRSRLAGR